MTQDGMLVSSLVMQQLLMILTFIMTDNYALFALGKFPRYHFKLNKVTNTSYIGAFMISKGVIVHEDGTFTHQTELDQKRAIKFHSNSSSTI